MSDIRLKELDRAKRAVKKAKEWNDLPKGRKYGNSKFKISIAHCNVPKLIRGGQQVCGGNNYWETDEDFGNAILKYLVDGWDDHYPQIIKILENDEKKALQACQSYIDEMQMEIKKAQTSD